MYIVFCYGLQAQLLYLYSTLVLVLHFTCTAHLCFPYKALMYILSLRNTIQSSSISNNTDHFYHSQPWSQPYQIVVLHIIFRAVHPSHLSISNNTLLFLTNSLCISFIESFTSASRMCLSVSRWQFERTSSVTILLTWRQKGP